MQCHLLLKLLLHGSGHLREREGLDGTLDAAARLALATLRVSGRLVGGSTFLVSSVPIRTFIIIQAVHECAELGTRVEVHLGALALLMVINQSLAVHAFGTLGILRRRIIGEPVPDRASRATVFSFRRPDFHRNIIINDDHFDVLHGDLCVLRLKIENVVVEVIDRLVKVSNWLGENDDCDIVVSTARGC